MFIEVQPYDSSHPSIINLDYVVFIEPTPYGSVLWMREDNNDLRMLRTTTKYEDWAHSLSAR